MLDEDPGRSADRLERQARSGRDVEQRLLPVRPVQGPEERLLVDRRLALAAQVAVQAAFAELRLAPHRDLRKAMPF